MYQDDAMFDFLADINLRQPLYLLVAIYPILLWLILAGLKQSTQNKFADSHLLPWLEVSEDNTVSSFLFSRNTAYFFVWVLFAFALAGPRVPDKSVKNQNEILMDIMLVVDLSRSMQAVDIKPSRLRRATLEAYEFLSVVKNARVGIIVYAARAHLYVPLTSDLNALRFYLKNLDTLQLPTHGGEAAAAIRLANKELQVIGEDKQKIILWMTDGDIETQNINKLEVELNQIKKANVETFILGLATEEGAAIPLPDGTWLESEGQAVITKINYNLLKQLIQMGYVNMENFVVVSEDSSDWDKLYFQGMIKSLGSFKHDKTQQWVELFSWILLPAILLLIVALFPISLSKALSKIPSQRN